MYDKQKLRTRKAIVSSPHGGQPDKNQNEQQQQLSANHSSDNAEIAPPSLTLSETFTNRALAGPQQNVIEKCSLYGGHFEGLA